MKPSPQEADTKTRLLLSLHDDGFTSGAQLGRELGISRAAVQKHFAQLRAEGAPVETVPGRGYRLASGARLLDETLLRRTLQRLRPGLVAKLEVHRTLDSTSSRLRDLTASGSAHRHVCMCEAQLAGRGRRGNQWVSTPYRNLMFSVAWTYPRWPSALTSIALALGTFVAVVLESEGVEGVGVKWPNDVIWGGRKLGGILVEVSGEGAGQCDVIVGVGINVDLDSDDAHSIEQQWVDLVTILGRPVDRCRLAVRCIAAVLDVLVQYENDGAGRDWWWQHWLRLDALRDQPVIVHSRNGPITGRCCGVDRDGALVVIDSDGQRHHCYEGEARVRLLS